MVLLRIWHKTHLSVYHHILTLYDNILVSYFLNPNFIRNLNENLKFYRLENFQFKNWSMLHCSQLHVIATVCVFIGSVCVFKCILLLRIYSCPYKTSVFEHVEVWPNSKIPVTMHKIALFNLVISICILDAPWICAYTWYIYLIYVYVGSLIVSMYWCSHGFLASILTWLLKLIFNMHIGFDIELF